MLTYQVVRDSDGDGAHAAALRLRPQVLQVLSAGTHFTRFTRFTGTKVQILTPTALEGYAPALFYSVYSFYWYKSSNTDAEGALQGMTMLLPSAWGLSGKEVRLLKKKLLDQKKNY